MAYRRASLIELYLHINFIEFGKTFLWTDYLQGPSKFKVMWHKN